MSLWDATEAATATGGEARGDWVATGVSIDTRSLQPGDLFVALTDLRDGHDFVAQALKKGAAAAMVSYLPKGVAADAPLLIVPDVLAALTALGRAGRARMQGRVAAVTGSVGKTSTKEMLRLVLAGQGRTHASPESYNNHWGVPLTLARMPADSEFAAIEIGMNHPGEIGPLSRLARPHVAMITTIAAAHLEAFDNIEGIAHEKAAIFQGLEPGGVAVVHGDVPTSGILTGTAAAAGAVCLTFGEAAGNAYRLAHVELSGEASIVQAVLPGEAQIFRISSPGRHFATNALGVLAVIDALGADATLAARDLALWQPQKGRGTSEAVVLDAVEDLSLTLFDDAYNANPTSVAAALEVLAARAPGPRAGGVGHGLDSGRLGRGLGRGRRIALLGDMLELGPLEAEMHADLAGLEWLEKVDVVHCAGPLMQALWQQLQGAQQGKYFTSSGEMAAKVAALVGAGDVVLVKGSLGTDMARVVDAIRKLGHPLQQDARQDKK